MVAQLVEWGTLDRKVPGSSLAGSQLNMPLMATGSLNHKMGTWLAALAIMYGTIVLVYSMGLYALWRVEQVYISVCLALSQGRRTCAVLRMA